MGKEKENEVEMPMGEFKREHNVLIKILNSGTRFAQKQEARKQSKELKKYAS